MKKKIINYFELANMKLSIDLPHTTKVKTPKYRAKQISVALHEATHFVVEMTHKCLPLKLAVANNTRGHDHFGNIALGSFAAIDTGGFSLIDSFIAAGFYEMICGNENGCDLEMQRAEEEYLNYQRYHESARFQTLRGHYLNVAERVISLWPLIYICAMAFLKYRRKSSLGEVPYWVLCELQDFVSTMLVDGTVIGMKDGEWVNLDYDYFSNKTPKMLDSTLWLRKHIQPKVSDDYKEQLSDLVYELSQQYHFFTSFHPMNVKDRINAI